MFWTWQWVRCRLRGFAVDCKCGRMRYNARCRNRYNRTPMTRITRIFADFYMCCFGKPFTISTVCSLKWITLSNKSRIYRGSLFSILGMKYFFSYFTTTSITLLVSIPKISTTLTMILYRPGFL